MEVINLEIPIIISISCAPILLLSFTFFNKSLIASWAAISFRFVILTLPSCLYLFAIGTGDCDLGAHFKKFSKDSSKKNFLGWRGLTKKFFPRRKSIKCSRVQNLLVGDLALTVAPKIISLQ